MTKEDPNSARVFAIGWDRRLRNIQTVSVYCHWWQELSVAYMATANVRKRAKFISSEITAAATINLPPSIDI